jgi:aryl-alcohol dehydrogenase-like predicted oxidoreductase
VQRYLTEANFDLLDKLRPMAEAHGRTMGELAIAWLLAQPQISSVIAGATRPEQVEANAKAAEWVLTAEEVQAIRGLLGGG